MPNHLAGATSPYLLQHADNPVDWYPWGEEAFALAHERDVPVLVSVGYAACHWCHVMAHESFEDPTTAAAVNAGFVAVKVDREERPDVDAAYMAAVTALTGQGGWPMTVFCAPDGRPFHAGTYYPPRPVGGMPAFGQVLAAVGQAWAQRREQVEAAGTGIAAALAERAGQLAAPPGAAPAGADDLSAAVEVLAGEEDTARGGFGGAPKFPPSMVLEFLLRHGATTAATAPAARDLAGRTLAAMARSGMADQVGGGFARYAVDAGWVVPHFEKMLYDNALLARAYLHWWRLTGEATGLRVALDACDWMVATLRTPQGGFAASVDADTDGVEGTTYVWTPQQLVEVLGDEDGAWAAQLLGVTAHGTFEHGSSTLQLLRDPWTGGAGSEDARRWAGVRARLATARAARPQPARDDKVVAAWNGLAIAALAEVGVLGDRPDLLEAARAAAQLLLDVHLVDDGQGARLRRVSRDGVVGEPAGVLEDLGDVAEGLLALHAATGQARWADAAGDLLDDVLARFAAADGALHDTPADGADPRLELMGRPCDPTDGATPSGTSAAAGALLTWAALTGSTRHREAAERALAPSAPLARTAPRFAGWALAVAQAAAAGPLEVAVLGPSAGADPAGAGAPVDPATAALHRVALASSSPGLVVAVGAPGTPGVPLLADRPLVAGAAAAYVCRGFSCRAPVTTVAALERELAASP